ncbi:MAG: 4'-phosphopantetheinyl transferase superfamily protein [Bacteroidales bacterium]|nr:4'-phosphopantetheinyl transferase superfamily protein [Bacteroidales bacterium]
MAIVFKQKFDNDCLLGIWEIKEDYNTLVSQLELADEDYEVLAEFKCDQRKLEWLSVRVLLNQLAGEKLRICYGEKRKPYVKNSDYNISISHSNNYTSVFLSKEHQIGIDLEYMSHRVVRIRDKFMNDREYISTNPTPKNYHLYIHWCAKEALYKICDKQDINFKDNLLYIRLNQKNVERYAVPLTTCLDWKNLSLTTLRKKTTLLYFAPKLL